MTVQKITDIIKYQNNEIYLRDMIDKDIDDYIEWYTVQIEWQDWDAPWEVDEESIDEMKNRFLNKLKQEMPKARTRFEICTNDDSHIGWVTRYYIDGNKEQLAVGLSIPVNRFWGKGLGELAITLFVSYLLNSGIASEIYTETWSGNYRMVRLAEKCGFEIVNREIETREVRGKLYDGLTFKLNKEFFWGRYEQFKHELLD